MRGQNEAFRTKLEALSTQLRRLTNNQVDTGRIQDIENSIQSDDDNDRSKSTGEETDEDRGFGGTAFKRLRRQI